MRRVHGRRGPLHPVLHRTRAFARARLGPHHDVPRLSGPAVVAREDSLVVAREDHVGIVGANRDVPGLATADREAVGRGDPGDRGAARDGHRGVVLLGTVDAIRRLVIRDHVIELGRRLVVDRRPALTAVERDDRAAVVPVDDPLRIVRVDPEIVMVAVRDRHLHERLAAIVRSPGVDVQHPRRLGILRIRVDVVVIPSTLPQVAVLAAALPVVAAVWICALRTIGGRPAVPAGHLPDVANTR